MGRAPCCDKANVKRGPWSPEEDSKLKDYITKQGTGGNWIALPQKAGLKRCGKSCRLRWLNYLRPNIKHGDFTDEEDRIICTLFATIGSRWSIIAAQLPGRTDNDIKNYWNTKLKKKLMAMAATPTHQYTSNSYHHKKSLPIDQASSPISPHKNQTSNFNYYNYTSTTPTKSFALIEPSISHISQFSHLSSISCVTPESPLQYNHNFPVYGGGSEPSLLCSINGRSHQIKQEVMTQMAGFEQLQVHQSFSSDNIIGCEENHKSFILGDHHCATSTGEVENQNNINLNHWAYEEAVAGVDDYELEHFKQLIDSSSSNNNLFNIDESKTKQEVMLFYN